MEAPIIAALVTAGGSLIGKLLEVGGRYSRNDPEADKKAGDVTAQLYDTLKQQITDGSFEILLKLESGENQTPFQIVRRMYPSLSLDREMENLFMGEFRYRLEYLKIIGLLTMVGGSEYAITRVGSAFVEEARKRRDYYRKLYPA